MEDFDECMILEILVRLPVKSVLRWKCVSRKWYRFISGDPLFRQRYLSSNTITTATRLLGFFCNKIRPKQAYPFVDFFPTPAEGTELNGEEETLVAPPLDHSLQFTGHQSFNIVSSSNGFLLCSLEEFNPMSYFVCNPVTKQYFRLPSPNFTDRFVAHGLMCQASTNHFQFNLIRCVVVRVTRKEKNTRRFSNSYTIELFDSIDSCDQWKTLNITSSSFFRFRCPDPPAIVRAEEGRDFVFYWLGISQGSVYGVAIFDPRRDYLDFIELPGGIWYTGSERFGLSDGLVLFARQNLCVLEIWILNTNENNTREWTLKHTTDFRFPLLKYSEIVGLPRSTIEIAAFHPAKPGVLFLYSKRKMVMYEYEKEIPSFQLVSDFRAQRVRYYLLTHFLLYVWPQSVATISSLS